MTGSEHKDERGRICDLLEAAGAVTRITTVAGAVRGNHFHEKTWQVVVVTKGALEVVARKPGCVGRRVVLRPGEADVSPPRERHAWKGLIDSECLVFTVGPRSGKDYESDTIRLAPEDRLL